MIIQRRSFLAGLGTLIAAPAIVRATALMPVKAITPSLCFNVGDVITIDGVEAINRMTKLPAGTLRQFVVTAVGPFNEAAVYPAIQDVGPYRTVVKRPLRLVPNLVAADNRVDYSHKPGALTVRFS